MDSFYKWLGKEDHSRIPFMMTAFGDIFYFRNFGDYEYDISFLDIHYRNISVAAYTVHEFIEYLVDSEIEEGILRSTLFDKAKNKLGILKANEIYFFAPALYIVRSIWKNIIHSGEEPKNLVGYYFG